MFRNAQHAIDMPSRLKQHAVFRLERWVQRGILYQLIFMASLVALVATLGGVLAWATTDRFANPFEGVWWAFLRLTDPGYLGDDEGATLRVISTAVTVLGYVLFMGSLIAIMTQWLAQVIRRLESGANPIVMANHIVVLGWTNRTPEVVRVLLTSGGRLKRFMIARHLRRVRIVVLADEVDASVHRNLEEYLRGTGAAGQVLLRSGSSLRRHDLERLELHRASLVLIPGADFELGGAEMTDTRIIKTLLLLDAMFSGTDNPLRPALVAEVFDPQKVSIARQSASGAVEVIPSDAIVSRLMFQALRAPLAGRVLLGLISGEYGARVFVRQIAEATDQTLESVRPLFRRVIPIGVVATASGTRRFVTDPGYRIAPDDVLVFLAAEFDDCVPEPGANAHTETRSSGAPADIQTQPTPHRVLILGWSYKLPTILSELAADTLRSYRVTVLSKVPASDRERYLAARHPEIPVEHIEGDYALESCLREAAPGGYDSVLFVASGWMSSGSEADARTILGFVLLEQVLGDAEDKPSVVTELLDPENAPLIHERGDVAILSPAILSQMLAQVALRPELNAVFESLFGAGGADITVRYVRDVNPDKESATYEEMRTTMVVEGETAIGFVRSGQIVLNPAADPDAAPLCDAVVVLRTEGDAAGFYTP